MKFYRLLPEEGDKTDEIVCRVTEDFQTKYGLRDEYKLKEGRFIEDWDNDFTFEFDPEEGTKPTDFMINDLQWVIVSQRVQQILDSLEVKNVQYLPLIIKNQKSGATLDGYSVVNVIELSDALDLEHSRAHELKSLGKSVLVVSKFALIANAVEGLHVLRLRDQTNPVFFSELAVKSLKRNSVTGCGFTEVKMV